MAHSAAYIVIGLFLLTILFLIKYQTRPHGVFGVLLLILLAGGFITSSQVINSFANEGVLTLILLMVCSLALEKTSFLRRLSLYIIRPRYWSSWVRLITISASASSVLNNSAVVATLLAPIRNNPHHPASKLLIPLSYAAILGGTLTLVGTSTNLIVNSMVIDAGFAPLGFFDFTLIGLSALLSCSVALALVSHWLPRSKKSTPVAADYFIDTKVLAGSPLVGNSIENNGLRNLDGLFLAELQRNGQLVSPVAPTEILQSNDRLLFSGDVAKVNVLNQFKGLQMFAGENGLPMGNLAEVILRPDSHLVGRTLKRSGFRALFDAAVVAIKRQGAALSGKLGEVKLQPGDHLVLAVGDDFKQRHNLRKNFVLLNDVKTEKTLSGKVEAAIALGFLACIVIAAMGVVSLLSALILYFGVLLLTKQLRINEVLPRVPVQIWVIIASALTLSHALDTSGALPLVESLLVKQQTIITPFVGLCMIYLITWLLTELITNNAAAALVFPIAIGMAMSLNIDPSAYIMAVAFGASASFMSPYGYQTNLMVFNIGHYTLKDFIRSGLPVSLVYGITVITGISLSYPL